METKDHRFWGWTLFGLYPFLFFGPIQILLAYPYPFPAWRIQPAVQIIVTAASLLPSMIGFSAGWMKRFPLWSYGYICLAVLSVWICDAILLDGKWNWGQDGLALASLLLLAGLLGLLAFLTRQDVPLQDLIRDIRSDWTRLSLGLMIFPAIFFGGIDHDEDPVLTIFVIGPTLVLLLAAGAASLVKTRQSRALILAAGMVLMILVRLGSGKWFYLFYWLVSVGIVFAPGLLQLLPRARKTSQGE